MQFLTDGGGRELPQKYQIDIAVVCARLAFEGMQALLCYSHWRVCSGAVCLPISTTTKMFFPLLKVEIHIWLAVALPKSTSSFAICQKGRTSDRSQAVLFTPPSLRGQGSDQAAPAAHLDDRMSDGLHYY